MECTLRCRDSKRWSIGNYLFGRISNKYLISICTGERAWRLCSSWHLAKKKPLHSAGIDSELRRTARLKQTCPLHCSILFARCQELHWPRSQKFLHSNIRNLYMYTICTQKWFAKASCALAAPLLSALADCSGASCHADLNAEQSWPKKLTR